MNDRQANQDSIRLDRLSDPSFQFGYTILPDDSCMVKEPAATVAKDLRHGIDWARCKHGEMPFCIQCKFPLTESNQGVPNGLGEYGRRFDCPSCKTSFLFK